MELKDVILSTIAELGEEVEKLHEEEKKEEKSLSIPKEESLKKSEPIPAEESVASEEEELLFLHKMRERLLVLFEGFQSPNNKSVEAKIDLTLNFLEYMLALIEERIKRFEKS